MEKYLIVGLGNYGKSYDNTWHNLGFMCLQRLAEKHGITCKTSAFKAMVGEWRYQGKHCLLVFPLTYMNASGEAVRDLMRYYRIPSENVLIIYDDIDLPWGKLRLRMRGSAGTHNGMRSVIYQIQTEQFPRLRIGMGPKPPQQALISYVLASIPKQDQEKLHTVLDKAVEVLEIFLREGEDKAQKCLNEDETFRRGL